MNVVITGADLLINNAGIMRQGESAEDFAQSFQVNSIAPFGRSMACANLCIDMHPRAVRVVWQKLSTLT